MDLFSVPQYAFEGRVLRVNQDDYSRWKKTYHTIADLNAELQRIDDSFEPGSKAAVKWFVATSAKLGFQHRKLMAEKRIDLGPKRSTVDSDIEQIAKAFKEKKPWLAVKNFTILRQLYAAGKITREQAEFCGYRP